MNRSGVRRRVYVPATSTQKSQTKDYQYVKGENSNSSNDDVGNDEWRSITDAREVQIGKWDTRRGNDLLSIPIGEAVNVEQASITGGSTYQFSSTQWFAQKVTATATGRLTALEANIRNISGGTGTVVLAFYTDVAASPGKEVMRTTIASSSITNTFQYLKGRSITCPDVLNATDYWIVGYVQDGGSGTYQISTTTNATTGKTSNVSGMAYTAAAYSFNVRLSTATPTGTKGIYRVTRPNGASYTFLAHDSSLYQVNETTGVTTVVDSGLDINSTYVRFDYVNDVLRYVQGTSLPRKYDFATASSVASAADSMSCIINHAGYEFMASSTDPNRFKWTNLGNYDTFNSVDFQLVPAPKTGDPIVAFSRLQGALYIHTRNNKYIFSGRTTASFSLDNAIGQKGTFGQESVVYDEDFIFLASDDGIYKFNGAEENNICITGAGGAGVLDWWTGLLLKKNVRLDLYNNRLYIFYTPNGEAVNSRCKVYNILYNIWESDDTKTYVGHTFSSANASSYFLQASNRVGMVMIAEQTTNDWNTMGEPLSYDLRTKYDAYGAPAQLKRVTDYRPHFDSVTGNYSVTMTYATDYNDYGVDSDISLAGTGPRFNTGLLFNSGVTFGTSAQVNPMDSSPVIAGEWRRLQQRYSHDAAREPVSFDGHILSLQTQRLM